MLGTLFLSIAALLAQVSFGASEGDVATVSHSAEVAQLRLEIAQLHQLLDATATASDASERRLFVDREKNYLPGGSL
eukprot:CAMPEP_0172665244 /NCGR_PEP_ID=MMETSP1074-20121228/7125_1 /TAXON_ID=2916 /ORGANISM="Ceratium fusus, Strain PA161109" /LENGTH=76 /DNA_ID=CAMNT_0013481527 /DNA_START=54 /DNA_END=281 /DNA_ORIENTATION=+